MNTIETSKSNQMDHDTTSESSTVNTDENDDNLSLRPMSSLSSCKGAFGVTAAPPTQAGGRERLLSSSANEEATQDFLHAQRINPQDKTEYDSNAAGKQCFASTGLKRRSGMNNKTKRFVELTEEEKEKVESLVESHCNKIFSLKSPNKNNSSKHDSALFVLPPAETLLTGPEWKVERLQQHKRHLNQVKGEAERGEDMEHWTGHTFTVNPAVLVFNTVKEEANPEFISQAFLKFYEVLCQFPIVPRGELKFNSVHLCEAPGAFIVALNHYLKLHRPHAKWSWIGNTLHPHYEGSKASECISDDRIILHTLQNWAFGADGTGNITLRCCLEQIKERCQALGDDINLVTADGSIDCQSNPGEQESTTSRLHYCEVLAGLEILARGGNMVVKMFTFFESSSISLLYLLCCVFDEVHVVKPITSKLGNSEVYVVNLGYQGQGPIRRHLDRLLTAYCLNAECNAIFSQSQIPLEFQNSITKCGKYFMEHQVNAIQRNARLYKDPQGLEYASCDHLQQLVLDEFLKKNPIKFIDSSQRILDTDAKWDINVHPNFSKHKKWTACYARNGQEKKLQYLNDRLCELVDQYANRKNQRYLFYYGVDVILDGMKITKGKPFEFIGTSRFCFEKILTMYITYIESKQEILTSSEVLNVPENNEDTVLFLRDDGSDSINGQNILEQNRDTEDLIKSIKVDYPNCNFLLQSYPSYSSPPTSSCKGLEELYRIISSNAVSDGATIYLVNIPLLSRLQNSLFVVLSSCFETVELEQNLDHQIHTGILCPPVLKLKSLDASKVQDVVELLRDVGWSLEAAEKKGVMELMDALSLIRSVSHQVVCRYNAEMMLVWSSAVDAEVRDLKRHM
uniref:Cap-specific mRNA (nucleoside-2'-O-)-methyltransferase 2 n=2 Tax=Hirondellea gigas TaxID=1518452 RepID=A0A2P2I624_9CRUS